MSLALQRRDEIWAVWRDLVRAFGFGRMLCHLSVSKSGLGIYGVDVISSLARTPMARAAQPHLLPLDDRQLAVLHELARINAERNSAIWKMAALFYVTGPTTLLVSSFQLAPDFVRMALEVGRYLWVVLFVGMTLGLFYYYSIFWRAALVQAVIELEQAQRRLDVAPS